MKTISNILTVIAAVFAFGAIDHSARAQAPEEKPEVGFIRIVNAVAPGDGRTTFLLDGEDLSPAGYELGQKTGGLGIKAGPHTVTIKKNGVEPGTTKLTVVKDETVTLIGFGEKMPQKKADDPPRWETKVLRLKQSDAESGYRLAVISLCQNEEIALAVEFLGRDKTDKLIAKRMVVTTMPLGKSRPEILIKHEEQTLASLAPETPGNYVVVLYEDNLAKIKALSFRDPKFLFAN